MRGIKFCLSLAVFFKLNSCRDEKDFVVIEAIKGVVIDHFSPNEPKFNLFWNGLDSEILANKLLREMPFEVSVRVIRLDPATRSQIEYSSILLFDSAEHYMNMYSSIVWMNINAVRHNNLVFAPKRFGRDLIATNKELNSGVENESLINIVNNTTVDLVTGFRFSPG
jgi:hypothetical protein